MPNANPPLGFLDNNFHDPDLDRFIDRVHGLKPEIAVIGDAYDRRHAESLQEAADALQERYDDLQCVTVPKCREAFDVFDDVVLGYPNGYSTRDPQEYSDPVDWRGRDIHVLGGNPLSQHEVMQELTQPTLAGHEPANIVGVDGNGVIKAAYMGKYWTPNGYEPADHLSIRETVEQSLLEIKGFWQQHGLWPDSTPLQEYGPAVMQPDDLVYATGGDIRTREALEKAYVATYDDELTLAFESETAQRFVEYRDNL